MNMKCSARLISGTVHYVPTCFLSLGIVKISVALPQLSSLSPLGIQTLASRGGLQEAFETQ
jgi:hypothetical protein